MGISCSTCIYYNGFINKCMDETVTKQMREPNDWCANHIFKPKQEVKQMKELINETIEVKLDGAWCEVVPVFEDDNLVFFNDPRPTVAPAIPISPVPQPITKVTFSCVNKRDKVNYRVSRFVDVVINSSFEIVDRIPVGKESYLSTQEGHKRAKLVL